MISSKPDFSQSEDGVCRLRMKRRIKMTNGDVIRQMSDEEKPRENVGILPAPCTNVNETTVKWD